MVNDKEQLWGHSAVLGMLTVLGKAILAPDARSLVSQGVM